MWIGPALLPDEFIEGKSDIRKPIDRELIYFRDFRTISIFS
jgi:hypothetical protein